MTYQWYAVRAPCIKDLPLPASCLLVSGHIEKMEEARWGDMNGCD